MIVRPTDRTMTAMQDLNDLYYFAKVVDAGGFAAAGRLLGIPKSRLSRRVAALEMQLGVRLLQRLQDLGQFGALEGGGTNRLAAVVEKLVPFMALVYIAGSLIVILCNITRLPSAVAQIFLGAFNPSAVLGGAAGVTVKEAIRYGVARGLFSNEAGMGSTPNAAAAASSWPPHPAAQGIVQMIGVFTDTIIICSASAMILLLAGPVTHSSGTAGIQLLQQALVNLTGGWVKCWLGVSSLRSSTWSLSSRGRIWSSTS